MDSLEAVQKSHQERLDYVTGERDQARKIAFAERQRAATAEERVLYVPVDTDKVAALEKQVKDLQERNDWQTKEVEAGWKFRNSTLELSEAQRRITDLEKQLTEKTIHADAGWARAMEVSEKCDKALNKIAAIKKLLDTCFGDNIIFGLASAIRTILNGGN